MIDVQRESKYYGFFFFWRAPRYVRGSPGGSHGKEAVCNAGDWGLIPESGRSPGEGNGIHSSILDWRIPWTEEPGGLQSVGSQRVEHN